MHYTTIFYNKSIEFYVIILSVQEEGEKIEKKDASMKQSFWELLRFAVIALAIVIPVRMLIAEPYVVSGSSMVPTFQNSNYLIVDKISYKLNSPKRNDVIVFKYPKDETKFFIKRIIALPNEIIDVKDRTITITNKDHQEGFILNEPYVENFSNNNIHYELKSNEYYVMGDNRGASSDSRYWGPVKEDLIVGKAFLRLLPLNKISIFPGSYTQ